MPFWSHEGEIDWDEFCTFMMQDLQDKEFLGNEREVCANEEGSCTREEESYLILNHPVM